MKDYVQLAQLAGNGNADAADFLVTMIRLTHAWDDLIDRDKPVTDQQINSAFWDALVTLPRNPFYRRHVDELQPVVACAINNWHIANRMERSDAAHRREVAYVLRTRGADLYTHVAMICGGPDHAIEVGELANCAAHVETFTDYLDNLAQEVRARTGAPHDL